MATPKRPVSTDFNTPSRDPRDSQMANGSASVDERTNRIVLENLRKELEQMTFRSERETGYANTRSNEDLVEDTTAQVSDPEMVERTGYLKRQRGDLQGGIGYGKDGGVFAGDTETANKRFDRSLEAAREALVEAEGAAPAYQAALIAQLTSDYPELASVTQQGYPEHPFTKLAAMYSDGMNQSTISGQRKARQRELRAKQPKTFY